MTISVNYGSYRPNQLTCEHQELTVDLIKVTVGVEDGRGGLAACDRAVRWRTMANMAVAMASG